MVAHWDLGPSVRGAVLGSMGIHPRRWQSSAGSNGSSHLMSTGGGGLRIDLAGLCQQCRVCGRSWVPGYPPPLVVGGLAVHIE
jgi:hypothetical protein